MAISSVSTATSGGVQQQYASQRQSQETERSREPRSCTETTREMQTQAAERSSAQSRRVESSQRPEQPKPVVNAQGQKTGTIINTTA